MDYKYQIMPPLSEAEYETLKADIAERGVQVPIEFDEDGNVLDGHHRLRACEELGITDYPIKVREGMSEDEKVMHALTLNTARRHLTPDQMLTLVRDILGRYPNKSNREIAKMLGISHPTVGKYRKQLERMGQVVKVTTREGADGKKYSVRDREEDLLKRDTYTCCICGKEHPAFYERIHNGRIVNIWGHDPWPLQVKGDCCEDCKKKIMDMAKLPPEAIEKHCYEEKIGPEWREFTDCFCIAREILSKRGYVRGYDYEWDYTGKYTELLRAILAERGIRYDATDDVYRVYEQSDPYEIPNDVKELCGPHWRELLDVAQAMYEEGWRLYPSDSEEHANTRDEWTKECGRRLREVGVTDLW